MIKITFPDGSVREYNEGVNGLQIAESISSRLAQDVLACGVNGETYDSLYFNEYLHKKDKYAVYFGGNYDKVDIEIGETTGQAAQTASSKGSLLILKDSFANSFVPYLLGDYSRITMIDSRYYRGSVTELAEDYDEVLILYGIDNFAGEKLHLSKSLIK